MLGAANAASGSATALACNCTVACTRAFPVVCWPPCTERTAAEINALPVNVTACAESELTEMFPRVSKSPRPVRERLPEACELSTTISPSLKVGAGVGVGDGTGVGVGVGVGVGQGDGPGEGEGVGEGDGPGEGDGVGVGVGVGLGSGDGVGVGDGDGDGLLPITSILDVTVKTEPPRLTVVVTVYVPEAE